MVDLHHDGHQVDDGVDSLESVVLLDIDLFVEECVGDGADPQRALTKKPYNPP